jgi:hypothetical protein
MKNECNKNEQKTANEELKLSKQKKKLFCYGNEVDANL